MAVGQGKGGGPKTEEGKARSCMNAVKTGENVKRYDLINENAGKLPMCKMCAETQQHECAAAKQCLKLRDKISDYFLSQEKRDPKYHEKYTIPQIAMMDMLYDWKLHWITENLAKEKVVTDKEGNPIGTQPVVDNQDFYAVINFMNALGKSPKDLQLTRDKMEQLDMALAELLTSASPERAEGYMQQIMADVKAYHESKAQAEQMRADDAVILRMLQQDKKAEMINETLDTDNIPDSPFKNGE